jgi:hypothetical protein
LFRKLRIFYEILLSYGLLFYSLLINFEYS